MYIFIRKYTKVRSVADAARRAKSGIGQILSRAHQRDDDGANVEHRHLHRGDKVLQLLDLGSNSRDLVWPLGSPRIIEATAYG